MLAGLPLVEQSGPTMPCCDRALVYPRQLHIDLAEVIYSELYRLHN